jgi:hypothetical protein
VRRRRRTWLAAACGAALAAACGGPGTGPDVGARATGTAEGVPPATERCAAVVFPPLQFGSHLLGDAEPPVEYSSTPPSSGWHLSGAPAVGVADTPLGEPAQVTTLEAGGVVITYRDLPAEDVEQLAAVAADHPRTVLVTEYAELQPGEVVVTSWGAQQRCEGVDVAALERYVAAYGQDVTTFEEDAGR